MQPCIYQNITKCSNCDQIVYARCPLFRRAHLARLLRSIYPFQLQTISTQVSDSIVWSRSADIAKSQAANWALKYNSPVVRISLSQVLSLQISNQEVEGKVFYLDCSSKVSTDVEKVLSVVKSFAERLSFNGCVISIYTTVYSFSEYKKIC